MNPNIFPRRSLKARVTLFVLSVFVTCIWSLALYSRSILHESVERLASEQQSSTVTYVAGQVDGELKDRIGTLELIAGAIDSRLLQQPEVLQKFLEQRFALHSLFNAGTFVTGVDGTAIASTPASVQRIGVNYLQRDHIASALKEGKAKIGEPAIGQVMGVPVVPMAVPIRDAQGEVIGALAGVTDLGKPSFFDKITENRYGKTGGYLLIAPQYRMVVTATDKQRIMQPLPPPGVNPQVDRFISGHEESAVFVNPKGESVLASTKRIPVAGWYVAVQLPTEEAFAPIHDMLQRLLFAAALLTLFAGGLTWWMLRRQLSPMADALHTLASLANSGHPPQPLPVINSQDEIGQLIAGFNHLLKIVGEHDVALAETLNRFQKIVSRVPGVVLQIRLRADGSLCVPYASETLRNIYRVTPEEVREDAFPLFARVHPDDRERHLASIRASAHDLTPWQEEYRLQFAGEADTWLLGSAVPEREANGSILWHGFMSDITERKEVEARLVDSEAHLRTIIENEPECIKIVDEQGCLTRMNPAGLAMIEADSLQQVAGLPVLDVIAPEYRTAFADMHRRVLAGEAVELKFEVLGLKGGRRWLETHAVPMLDHGKVVQLAVTRDISERMLAEEKLHLAASVFTHAREGITITAADGTIIDVNDTFCRITGYSREEVLGKNPRILGSGRQGKEFYTAMWRDLVEKGHWYGEIWNRRKNGEVYAEMLTVSAVRDPQGHIGHYVALFSDITQIKDHQRQLEHIAHFDALTRLPNRVLLADRMHQAMAQAQRRGHRLAVAYLDLDGFKAVNDHHGHDVGDQLLMAVAGNMQHALRDGDTLARLGGDEFVAMLLDLASPSTSVPMLSRLLAAASEAVQVGDVSLQVSASVGVTFYPQEDEIDADQLLRQADQAMYQAKLAGKNRYHIFDAEQDRHMRGHHESTERIRRALIDGEFVLHYQPKVNMRTGAVVGAEALIRWQHPEDGLLAPIMFLPTIEDHPLAVDIGEWVIDAALKQLETWQAAGLHIPVSVNVGARQLQQADFVQRLRRILARHPQVDPNDLELEVLETSALEDLDRISQVITDCREIGVTFALDDFGTGYSSLTYLKRLPVTLLKIDQSFVRDMLDDPDDMAILDGVIGLASAFRRMVIAEGVETIEHGTALLQLGCVLAQGFGIARPMPADELPAWSANWRTAPAWKKLQPVGSDNLPLLFASVEHRAAVAAIKEFLKSGNEASPPQDQHKYHFGLWLKTEGFALHGSEPAFRAVFDLHEQVHALSNELCALKTQGRIAEAQARLNELDRLRDALLEQLQKLMRIVH